MCNWVPAGHMPEVRKISQQALLAQIVVAQLTGVGLAELCASERGGVQAAFARHTAMYMCRLVYAMSLRDIAVTFGRDRSTAKHAIQRIEEAREHPDIDRRLAFIETTLRRDGGLHG